MLDNKQEKKGTISPDDTLKKEYILKVSFIGAIIVFILFVVFRLFVFNNSIFDICVSGNDYLNDQDIIDLCDINNNYYLNIPFILKRRLNEHPLIESCEVSYLDGNIIGIKVIEKKLVAYSLNLDGQFELLTSDNERYVLKDNEIYLISNVPLLGVISDEKQEKFCKKMMELDSSIIKEISEINSYPFSYDEDMFEFIMSDGNYCFVSLNDIDKIVEYYSISFNIDKDVGHACIYVGDFTISAYSSTCPWQEKK